LGLSMAEVLLLYRCRKVSGGGRRRLHGVRHVYRKDLGGAGLIQIPSPGSSGGNVCSGRGRTALSSGGGTARRGVHS